MKVLLEFNDGLEQLRIAKDTASSRAKRKFVKIIVMARISRGDEAGAMVFLMQDC